VADGNALSGGEAAWVGHGWTTMRRRQIE
jgi:hypothetical protein